MRSSLRGLLWCLLDHSGIQFFQRRHEWSQTVNGRRQTDLQLLGINFYFLPPRYSTLLYLAIQNVTQLVNHKPKGPVKGYILTNEQESG